MRILVVEDEPKVSAFLKKGLEEQGFHVDVAYDGRFGLKLARENIYDLIILDVILPGISGLELCEAIRQEDTEVPILMLTALGTTDDIATGLETGADDYLVKPFQFRELLARINALSRRAGGNPKNKILSIADLEMDLSKKVVRRAGQEINLTPREFFLLEFLIKNRDRVVSRSEIAASVWEDNFDRGTNVVDVYINYLRNKVDKHFEPKLIHTVMGMGYILSSE